jgi:archaellum component FlaC
MKTQVENDIHDIKKHMGIMNREMGETRDEVKELKVDMIKGVAKLKEDLTCEINRQMDESKKDRALIHQELGVIKEQIKYGRNGAQWFEKTLIFLIGVLLTVIGFLIKMG